MVKGKLLQHRVRQMRPRWMVLPVLLVVGTVAYGLQLARMPTPEYDLLFSIDYNDSSYNEPPIRGAVVRVNNHTADFLPSKDGKLNNLHVYVCKAATGVVIQANTRDLTSLTIDTSSTAPNGYSLSRKLLWLVSFDKDALNPDTPKPYSPWHQMFESISFARAYPIHELVDDGLYIDRLRADSYAHCLGKFSSSTDPNVHFIGWIVSRFNSS